MADPLLPAPFLGHADRCYHFFSRRHVQAARPAGAVWYSARCAPTHGVDAPHSIWGSLAVVVETSCSLTPCVPSMHSSASPLYRRSLTQLRPSLAHSVLVESLETVSVLSPYVCATVVLPRRCINTLADCTSNVPLHNIHTRRCCVCIICTSPLPCSLTSSLRIPGPSLSFHSCRCSCVLACNGNVAGVCIELTTPSPV